MNLACRFRDMGGTKDEGRRTKDERICEPNSVFPTGKSAKNVFAYVNLQNYRMWSFFSNLWYLVVKNIPEMKCSRDEISLG